MIPCKIYPVTGDESPQDALFVGLIMDENDGVAAVVRTTRYGMFLQQLHPSRVELPVAYKVPEAEAPSAVAPPAGARFETFVGNDGNPTRLTAAEHFAARKGDRICAIKSVRQRTGLGLREAKQIVDEEVPS
jgi:hypothetical protein